VIRYPLKAWGLCASLTGARYTTTTEVYPDSPRATPEQCIAAQVAAVGAAVAAGRLRQRFGAVQRGQATADQQVIPAGAVLLVEQHRVASGVGAGRHARRLYFHQRDQAMHLGLRGASSASMRPRRRASLHSSGRIQSPPLVAV
jgi:hypothetical protein